MSKKLSAINKQTYDGTTAQEPFMLILKKGDNLFEGILDCAAALNLQSASISGLGALYDVTVAYYDLEKKQYESKLMPGEFELISVNGNISFVDDKHFVHIHAALGTRDYSVIGGHIMDATIGPTAELTIIPFPVGMHRKLDEDIGLKLICPLTSREKLR